MFSIGDRGDIVFATAKAGTTSTKMTLDEDGRLGIGISSPSYKVHAQGTDGTAASIRAEATAADSDAFIVTVYEHSYTISSPACLLRRYDVVGQSL